MHSAQGVTADTSHAVLGENTNRAPFYVAITRTHVKTRSNNHEAADLLRGILANHDQPAIIARDYATRTPDAAPPDRVRSRGTTEIIPH